MRLPAIDRKLLYITIVVLVLALGALLLRQAQPPAIPLEYATGGDGSFAGLGAPEPFMQKDGVLNRAASSLAIEEGAPTDSGGDRLVIRTGTLKLIVETVEAAATAITERAAQLGGLVESSNISRGEGNDKTGYLNVRVPADRFDEAMNQFADIAVEVENRSSNASDITRQFVDLEARLKNARAEEVQYQSILERAQTVEDILNVSRALNEVRSRIEQMQAELTYLSSQTDMATISVFLNAEGDVEVFGVRWRPLIVARQAVRELLEKLVAASNMIIRLVILLPVVLLWLAVFSLLAYLVWKVIAWLQRYLARRDTRPPLP